MLLTKTVYYSRLYGICSSHCLQFAQRKVSCNKFWTHLFCWLYSNALWAPWLIRNRKKKLWQINHHKISHKIHIFWEGHNILGNLHQLFVLCIASQIMEISQNFLAFSEYMNFKITILVEKIWTFLPHWLETMKLYAYILATSYGTTVRQKSHVLLMPCHHNITRIQYIFYYLYFDGLSFHFLQNSDQN